jgi:hypothetical protein
MLELLNKPGVITFEDRDTEKEGAEESNTFSLRQSATTRGRPCFMRHTAVTVNFHIFSGTPLCTMSECQPNK